MCLVCVFQGLGPFHLTCQIYLCKIIHSTSLLSFFMSARSIVIVHVSFMTFVIRISFFFSLARGLSILLIFKRIISLLHWLFSIFMFSISLISVLYLCLSSFCLLWVCSNLFFRSGSLFSLLIFFTYYVLSPFFMFQDSFFYHILTFRELPLSIIVGCICWQ